ncbi:MAG: hypothetical protein NT080_09220 [Spirochaetes bacterium]|nr:hypothetical protein [Spirochaetota bacterium]
MRLLLLYARSADPGRRAADEARFTLFRDALAAGGIEAVPAGFSSEREFLSLIRETRPDLIFCAAHRVPIRGGPPRGAHDIIEELRIPFVGSSARAIELALDKDALKRAWLAGGVRTPAWFSFGNETGPADDPRGALDGALDFPYIVKPALEGNSRGISRDSVVRSSGELRAKADSVVREYGPVIVERFLEGPDRREFTVAMIGNGDRSLVMPAELTFREPTLFPVITTDDKDGQRTLAVPVEDPALSAKVSAFARSAFAIAGVRDYARGDFILSGGELYAIEVNGQPMVPDSWFAACSRGAGLGEEAYLNAIVLAAAERVAG